MVGQQDCNLLDKAFEGVEAVVQNRVNKILSLTEQRTWNHCRDVENPAHIGSRGGGAANLESNVLCWKGPSWLSVELAQF